MKKALPKIAANAENEFSDNKKKIKKWKIVSGTVGIVSLVLIFIGILVTRFIFYEPIYKFSTLSPEDQVKVENAPIIYKKVDVVFHDLFPKNSSAYDKLTSEHITKMLNRIPLNFDDSHFLYLDELIIFKWNNLTKNLKVKFLNSNFTFQNESLKFDILNKVTPLSFNFLTSQQIVNTLDNKVLIVHKMISNSSLFYTERRFFIDFIYEIYYLYMYERANKAFINNCLFFNETYTFDVSLENFYNNFTSQDFDEQNKMVNQIRNFEPFRACFLIVFRIFNSNDDSRFVDSLYDHSLLQLDFENVLKHAIDSKIFILSDVPGAGKTTSFQQFTIRAKKIYPEKWVSYIDVRDVKEFLNKTTKSIQDAKEILENIFGLSVENEFEKSIFQEHFSLGNVILYWDHFDQVPDFKNNVAQIIFLIFNQTNNIQFLSTRKLYSDALREIFLVKIYALVPLIDFFGDMFIKDFFNAHEVPQNEISIYSSRVVDIILTDSLGKDFYTPFLLDLIAENVLVTNYTNETYVNTYVMFETFVKERIRIWSESDFAKKFINDNLINSDFSLMKFYQKYMINYLRKTMQDDFYFLYKLKIMRMHIPEELSPDQVARMGILYINGPKDYELVHESFVCFFTAKYLIDSIYNADDDPSEEEAELRIRLFFLLITKFEAINDLIADYISSITNFKFEEFHPNIAHVLRTKFRNIFVNAYKIIHCIPSYFLFFHKDHKLFLDLLQIKSDETILDATFDFINMVIFTYPFDIDERNFTVDLFHIDLNKNDYEMVIQKRHELKGMLQYSLYLLYNRYENYDQENIVTFYGNIELDKNLLENTNVTFVFESLVNNLTEIQLKKFLCSRTSLYPLIKNSTQIDAYFYQDVREGPIEFFEFLWNLIENTLSEQEIKTWLASRFEIFFLFDNIIHRNFFIGKAETYFKKSQLFQIYLSRQVIHLTSQYNFDNIQFAFNYIFNITTHNQKRELLKQQIEVECFPVYPLSFHDCYKMPPMNILQKLYLRNYDNGSYDLISNLYFQYFNTTELQKMILSDSKDYIPFIVAGSYEMTCFFYAKHLKAVFKENKNDLKQYLSQKIGLTRVSIIEVISEYDDREKLVKLFTDLCDLIEDW